MPLPADANLEADLAQREHDSQYRMAFEASRDGIILRRLDRTILDCNAALCRMLGYEADELIGEDVLRIIHPDDVEWLRDQRKRRSAGEAVPERYLMRLVRKDGSSITVETSSALRGTFDDTEGNIVVYRDVTDSVDAGRDRRESDERFRAVFDDSQTPLVLIDAQTRLPQRNQAFADMLGYTLEEFGELPRGAFMIPADVDAGDQRLDRLFAGGDPDPQPYARCYKHRNGQPVEVMVQESVLDVDGERVGILFSTRDVTSERVAQAALRDSEDRFRSIFEDSLTPMAFVDIPNRNTTRNRAFVDMLGYSPDEISKVPPGALMTPDDAETANRRFNYTVDGMPVDPDPFARRLQHRDGRMVDVIVQMSQLSTDGGGTGVLASLRDVTAERAAIEALQESEDRFRSIFDDSLTPLVLMDASTSKVTRNRAFAEMLGYPADEISDLPRAAFILPDDSDGTNRRLAEYAVSGKTEAEPFPRRYKHRDGHFVDVVVQASPLNVAGQRVGALASFRDVTVERAALAALQESEERFRAVFEDSLTPMSFVDAGTLRTTRNQAFAEMLGYSQEEFARLPRDQMLAPADQEEAEQRVERLLDSDDVATKAYPRRYLHKSGHSIDTMVQLSLLNIEGRRVGVLVSLRDVTAERAAQQARQESEERFRAVFEDSLTPLALADAATGHTTRNRAYAAMLGYTSEEIADLPRSAFILPSDMEPATELLQSMLDGSQRALGPYTRHFVHKDGHVIDAEGQASTIEVAGERVAVLFSARDTTIERAAQTAIQESEEHYRTLFETAQNGNIVVGRDGRLRFANAAAARLLGREDEGLVGMDYGSLVHPDEREQALSAVEAVFNVPAGQTLRESPRRIRRLLKADGSVVTVDITISLYREDGEVTGLHFEWTDMTALLESEEHYRTLFETAHVGNVVIGHDRKVRFANQAAAAMLRCQPDDLIGKAYSEFVREDERESVESLLDGLLSGDREFSEAGLARPLRRVDGTAATVHVTSSFYREGGEVTGIHVEWIDATEILRLRDQLLQSQKLEAVGTLVAGVAHDFNNLLTGIGGSIERATAEHGDSPWLDRASVATDRASDLVQQLLRFSKQIEASPTDVDAGELATETVFLVRETVDRRISILLNTPDTTAHIAADRTQIHQVLMNLILNACDAVTERLEAAADDSYEPRVNVAIRHLDQWEPADGEATSWVELSVSDNGIGISPEVRARIFDPFFSTKETDRGTGLGLSTAYGIVRDHGGSISVESAPGEGSKFAVRLPTPLFNGETADDGGHAIEAVQHPDPGGRVLVVDDEVVIGEILDGVLSAAGYEVVCAIGGREALRLANDQTFDLVLLDINMPGIDGWEVLAELRQTHTDLPVIMVSGYAHHADAMERGARRLIQKPFDSSAMLAAVGEEIRTH